MLPNVGFPELIVILVLALVLFGPKKLPDLGRAIGQGLREFRRASRDIAEEIEATARDGEDGGKAAAHPARRAAADRAEHRD